MTDISREAVERVICNKIISLVADGRYPTEAGWVAMIETARALRDALDRAETGVKVKQLGWDKHPDDNEWYGGSQENLVGINEYDILPHPCAIDTFVLDVMGNRCERDFSSVEDAKAAAQADYERRILAALALPYKPQEDVSDG